MLSHGRLYLLYSYSFPDIHTSAHTILRFLLRGYAFVSRSSIGARAHIPAAWRPSQLFSSSTLSHFSRLHKPCTIVTSLRTRTFYYLSETKTQNSKLNLNFLILFLFLQSIIIHLPKQAGLTTIGKVTEQPLLFYISFSYFPDHPSLQYHPLPAACPTLIVLSSGCSFPLKV
ncbi:hypothetical protein BDZ91DRAFT_729478 [Kalaharituber pfeilii]|nr:hypothetical protein BDZ91DRAFT_729478 [Kalaharituber pfeilii]